MGQDQAVRGDDGNIGLQRTELLLRVRILKRFRRANRNAVFLGDAVNRRRCGSMAASGGTWRLAIDRDDIVAGDHRPQDGNRKVGRAHEDDPHRHPTYSAACKRRSFFMRRMMMLRLMVEM